MLSADTMVVIGVFLPVSVIVVGYVIRIEHRLTRIETILFNGTTIGNIRERTHR